MNQMRAARALVELISLGLADDGSWEVTAFGNLRVFSTDPADVERLAEHLGAEITGLPYNGRFQLHADTHFQGVSVHLSSAVELPEAEDAA